MIKSFGALYQGQIDMEGVGDDGIPANDRRYSNDELTGVFGTATEIAQTVDDLGYDILWMAEHHFQHEGYECIPNIILLATHLAGLTKCLRFGCGFNVLPAWHPLRLAEDFATADVLTGGRVIFGIGRGYHTREVETFGAPMLDSDANRALFEEQFEIIMKAFESKAILTHRRELHHPAVSPVQGIRVGGDNAGAASGQHARGGVAAAGERQSARHRLHGAKTASTELSPPQPKHSLTGGCAPTGTPPQAMVTTCNWARTSRSDTGSSSRRRPKRR